MKEAEFVVTVVVKSKEQMTPNQMKNVGQWLNKQLRVSSGVHWPTVIAAPPKVKHVTIPPSRGTASMAGSK
jgi:hypothetical protein